MEKDVILTPEGYEKLQKELETLTTDRRRDVADRIREAREFGDISENSEYDDAKNEQAMLENQIAKLEEQLRAARVIDSSEVSRDTVSLGSQVTVEHEGGKKATYMIVGSAEADPLSTPGTHLERVAGRPCAARPQEGREDRRLRAAGHAEAQGRLDLGSVGSTRMVGLPHRFADRSAVADVLAAHEDLEPGASSGTHYRLAGRVLGRRGHGQGGVPRPRGSLRTHPADGVLERARRAVRAADRRQPRRHRRRLRRGGAQPPRRALAAARLLRAARAQRAAAAGQAPRPRRRRDALPPALPRPADQPRGARRVRAARTRDHARCAASSTAPASSRSRRRRCSRSTAAPTRGRSRRTTTSSIATSTCGSRPSCT